MNLTVVNRVLLLRFTVGVLAPVALLSACRPPPPAVPPEPAPPLPSPALTIVAVPCDSPPGAIAVHPLTGRTALVYRADRTGGPTPPPPEFVQGSSPHLRALRLDRGSLTGPLDANLTGGFSIALRVRIDGQGAILGNAGASNGTIIAVGNGYSDGFRITADTPRRTLAFSIGRPTAPHAVTVVSPPVSFGQWLHVAATWDGQRMRLYVDGWPVAERTMTNAYTVPSRNTLAIGYADAGVGSLNMAFERADLFTHALSPSACLRLIAPEETPAVDFVELWDSLSVPSRREPPAEALTRLDDLRAAATIAPMPFRLAARRLEADFAVRAGLTARAADAFLDLLERPDAPAEWSRHARDELRHMIRDGAAGAWPTHLLNRLAAVARLDPLEQLNLELARLSVLVESGDAAAARRVAKAILDAPQAAPAARSTVLLSLARLALEARDLATMREHLRAVLALDGAPLTHRDEAERLLADSEPDRPRDRLPPEPALPPPAIELYVAPHGNDANPGTRERPFATAIGARDALRRRRASAAWPVGGATIWLAPGRYPVRTTLTLDARDSGAPGAPVVWRALDPTSPPRFDGGLRVRPSSPSSDVRRLADSAVADRLVEFDLAAHGLTNLPPLILGGYGSGHGFRTHPTIELFANGSALPRSRWPNDAWAALAAAHGTHPVLAHGRPTGAMTEGIIGYEGDRPARWTHEPALLLHGYWHHRWADSYEHVAAIRADAHRIELAPPWHRYGFKPGGLWAAVNAVSEIDRPGEWAMLPDARRIVALPPADAGTNTEWVVSACTEPMVRADNLAHVAFVGLMWEYGAHDALQFRAATNLWIAGCTIRHFAGDAIRLDGGLSNIVRSCDIVSMGRGGIHVTGGDRRTLTPGAHQILNCHIHHLSRIHPTYTPAISLAGVGHRIAHCLAHDIRSSAIRVAGNDHLVEMNEICHVVTESDDQGGVDMWGDPTFRGNRFLHNFWHHIGRHPGETMTAEVGRAGIRLDDAISGVLIRGNIFLRCGAGARNVFGSIQIHGGKDNEVDGNVIALAPAAVSFSPWSESRWREYIAGALDRPQVHRDLFLRRYPSLADLPEHPNRNFILRNFIWRCDMLGWRAPGAILWVHNTVFSESDIPFVAPEQGDFRLKPGRRAPGCLGPEPIPFELIGLRPDPDRPTVPTNLIRRLRQPPAVALPEG